MRGAVLPVLIYAGLILALSSIPGSAMPFGRLLSYDLLLHFAEYAIFGFLLARAVRYWLAEPYQIFLLTLALVAAFAALDEVYQSMIPERISSLEDWLADLVGATLALSVYLWIHVRDQSVIH